GNILGLGSVAIDISPYWPGNNYVINGWAIGNVDHDSSLEVVLLCRHKYYFPAMICVYEADATLICRHWNPGHLYSILLHDINTDGIKEILAAGVNSLQRDDGISVPIVMALAIGPAFGGAPARAAEPDIATEIWYNFLDDTLQEAILKLSVSGDSLVCDSLTNGGGPSYTVRLEDGAKENSVTGDCLEPNDDYLVAFTLVNGLPLTGLSISPASDADWFGFTIDRDSSITVETSGDGGDTWLGLYDADQVKLAGNDDYGSGYYSMISLKNLSAGTYYVRVGGPNICGYNILYTAAEAVGQNTLPCISLVSAAGNSGDISLNYRLLDNGDICNLTVQYSLDNGSYWNKCTAKSGTAVTELSSTPAGTDHSFIWDSCTDFQVNAAAVLLRLKANDGLSDGFYAQYDLGAVNNAPQSALSISGNVVGADPCVCPKVSLWQRSKKLLETNTDSSGVYGFSGVGAGTYRLIAYCDGYYPGTREANLIDSLSDQDIILTEIPAYSLSNLAMFVYGSLSLDHDSDGIAEPAVPGDVVTALDSDGLICGKFTVTESGRYGNLTIYGDSALTESIDEGCLPEEPVTFLVNGVQVCRTATFTPNQFLRLDLGESAEKGGAIQLKTGWNLISLGVQPTLQTVDELFASIPEMRYVLGFFRSPDDTGSEGFRTYMNFDNLRQFSTLKTMDGYHGYWVYMTADAALNVAGSAVQAGTERQLGSGWNLAGYWKNEDKALPYSLDQTGTVIDSIFNANPSLPGGKVKYIMGFYRDAVDGNEGFRTFLNTPAMDFSTLKKLHIYHGYWIYMDGDGELDYDYVP
ncbi:MAG: pre-peptidase C-terminal domain-containing protein, partial [Candidatus Wallbacteria bacterium]|nr:pre-peptidase C-terminal domain-containing protein [Candidatus Wallbacteria bacterium]